MTKTEFYAGKVVIATEWWLDSCELPALRWGRLRVFDDGTADACFEEGDKLYGFNEAKFAGFFLAEDEYISLKALDEEDEKEYGISLERRTSPGWQNEQAQEFEYGGTV